MKTLIYLGFIAVAAITIVTAAELSSQNNGPTELAQVNLEILKAKVERLERKTADLQKEIAELREQQQRLSTVSQNSSVAPLLVNPSPKAEIPSGWSPREFNGLTYYLVPLGQDTQHANGGAK